jgi:CBS domain-containing protein
VSKVYAEKDFEQLIVPHQTPISKALSMLNRTKTDVLLLCQSDYQLVGTLSSGDIRQAILEKGISQRAVPESC